MKHIYYHNDFAVEVELFNFEGVKVSPPEWKWSIEFSDSRKKYVCSLEKGNAEVMDDGSVMCYLDNHNFYCGRLSCKFKEQIPNLSYLDGFQRVIRPTDIDVELWDKPSDNDGNVSVSVIPDYVIYDAYMTAKANGYTGTAEEFYDALNHIVDINKNEAYRMEAEANRVNAEQQRVENFAAMESALTTATNKANTATIAAEQSAERANTAADNADVATSNATTATTQATNATKRANDISADLEAKREADYWRGAKGDKGDKGDTGAKGDRGEKGDQGERGLQGVQGVKGDDGVSPTVSTSKTGKVTTIEITDANGVHTATVNDGDSVEVVQSTGTSTTEVMSQKASTDSFIANTPSGDPMHNMYVAIGAVWNGTGVDKTYPTPWADYAEEEEDKVCVHKTGHWKFYDVGDLTNSDMIYVYRDFGLNIKFTDLQFIDSKSRIISLGWHNDAKSFMNDGYEPFALCSNLIEIAFYKNKIGIVNIQGNCAYIFAFSQKLKYIYGNLKFINSISNTSFIQCLDLRIIFVNNLGSNIYFKDSPKLSKHCVRYMIENATDATITITLHPEAYDRAIADTGVQTALANKTNVSLAKPE